MPRRRVVQRREVLPDARFNDWLVAKFVNHLMLRGKKAVAEAVFYEAMDLIARKTKEDPLKIFKRAVENVKPQVEVKSRRVGGATYQVPVEIKPERRTALAIRWLIQYAKARPDHSMKEKIAAEFMAAAKNDGGAIKKRDDTHRMAEANKAFAHYRW